MLVYFISSSGVVARFSFVSAASTFFCFVLLFLFVFVLVDMLVVWDYIYLCICLCCIYCMWVFVCLCLCCVLSLCFGMMDKKFMIFVCFLCCGWWIFFLWIVLVVDIYCLLLCVLLFVVLSVRFGESCWVMCWLCCDVGSDVRFREEAARAVWRRDFVWCVWVMDGKGCEWWWMIKIVMVMMISFWFWWFCCWFGWGINRSSDRRFLSRRVRCRDSRWCRGYLCF